MVSKITTDVSLLSGIGASITPEIRIPRKKRNLKSPENLPPRNNPVPNQDSTIITTQQDPNLPPHLSKLPTEHKPFIDDAHFSNPTENENTDTTDNTRTDNEDSVDKMNVDKDDDKDD